MFGVKSQRRLNVFVPVRPIVGARKFSVFVRDIHFLQMLVKFAVLFDERITAATIDAKCGRFNAIAPRFEMRCKRENIVFSADGSWSADARKFAFSFAPTVVCETITARMSVGRREQIRVLEREFDGAISAHRKPADAASGAFGAGVERAVDEADAIVDDGAFISETFGRVAVKTASAVGHHDDERQHLRITPDAGFALPHAVIIGQTVQQVENGIRPAKTGHFGNDDVASRLLLQRRTGIMKLANRHNL